MESWLDPLLSAAEMRSTDARAIEDGVSSLELMERAGAGLARITAQYCPDGRILVVCGKGNNGGDGFVAARHLASWGHDVAVALVAEPSQLAGDALVNFERLPVDATEFNSEEARNNDCIVDALLGTGFTGVLREPIAEVIAAINAVGRTVVSADIPSGVDASSGEVSLAVRASATVTFHAPKVGLNVWPGKEHAGRVEIIDIGIPPSVRANPNGGLISEAALALFPRRGTRSSKFSSGRVGIVGGSTGLTGAPSLSAIAAARAGAGYVTVAVPSSLNLIFEQRLLEQMTVPLADSQGALTSEAVGDALSTLERTDAAVVGPGLGRHEETRRFTRELLSRLGESDDAPALVLDADGLNAFAGSEIELPQRTVLTPHEGELGRLLEVEPEIVAQRRLHYARSLAETTGVTVILKGDDTLVATSEGRFAVSRGNCPALATAGTGDVLSGILGALLSKALDPFTASCVAVQLHLLAGKAAAEKVGAEGVIASDVANALPAVLSRSEHG